MRLPRPYVPWSTRRKVIERQAKEYRVELSLAAKYTGSDERGTRFAIEEVFGPGVAVELHHRPALCNREVLAGGYIGRAGKYKEWKFQPIYYEPDANDPDFLVYLPVDEHDVETRVRGLHGQHSDLGLRRKHKRMEKKREQTSKRTADDRNHRRPSRLGSRPLRSKADFLKRPKHKWPKRKLRSRNNLRKKAAPA